jgi:two-component system CheB/CheR fusion protein
MRLSESTPADRTASLEANAFEAGEFAQVLLDAEGAVAFANERARLLFGLPDDGVGTPVEDIGAPSASLNLRSLIDQARLQGAPLAPQRVEWHLGQERALVDVHVTPLTSDAGESLGAGLTFVDVTHVHDVEGELRRSRRDVKSAYDELRSVVDELEARNSERRSTNDELEGLSSELRSTNEELETMARELRSTNDELHAMTAELTRCSLELSDIKVLVEPVLVSVRPAVVVTDRDLRVVVWNQEAEGLLGLAAADVEGQDMLGVDVGFPAERLRPPLRACVSGASRRETFVTTAMGDGDHPTDIRVTCTPVARDDGIHGVLLLMERIDRPPR